MKIKFEGPFAQKVACIAACLKNTHFQSNCIGHWHAYGICYDSLLFGFNSTSLGLRFALGLGTASASIARTAWSCLDRPAPRWTRLAD